MRDTNPITAAVAAYRPSKVPGCAPFLMKQLRPVSVTRKKLNDGDEAVTKAALDEMVLLDPRITHTCKEQIALITNDDK